jgi:uncharacterized RDD family membrane protein YckC
MTGEQLGQVTGRYAGPLGRLAAFAVDSFAIVVLYGVIVGIIAFTVRLITGYEINTDESDNLWWLLGYVFWAFVYFWVSTAITGRTVGKWLVGLRIVQRDGTPLRGRSAFIRVVTMPLSFLLLGLGLVGIVIGREHRALHDVFAKTVVVYDWGDRPAEMPAPLTRFLNRREVLVDEPAPADVGNAVSESA